MTISYVPKMTRDADEHAKEVLLHSSRCDDFSPRARGVFRSLSHLVAKRTYGKTRLNEISRGVRHLIEFVADKFHVVSNPEDVGAVVVALVYACRYVEANRARNRELAKAKSVQASAKPDVKLVLVR